MKLKASALAVAAMLAPPLAANEFAPAMASYLESDVRSWATNAILLDALRAQNETTVGYDQGTIDAMDQAWRAEVGGGATPTIDPVLGNAAANFLREQVEASGGRMTEVILMDAVGLNVAVSHVTSDMWQGDEEKYQETYLIGANGVHFSDIEQDESTGRYQGQISFTVVDPASGTALGAITVGVDADSLL